MYLVASEDIVVNMSEIRTPEQRMKKMIKEERTIVDLQMAIKKEQFRNYMITRHEFNEKYDKVDTPQHDCWVFT